MHSLWRYVLRQSVTSLAGLTVLLFVVLVFVAVSIQQQLRVSQLAIIGESYQRSVTERYDQVIERLGQFSSNSIVINALVDYNGRDAYLPSFIENLSLSSSIIAPLAVVDFQGELISTNANKDLQWFVDDSLWQEQVLVQGDVWVDIDEDYLFIAQPIKVNELSEGAMIASLPLTYLMQTEAFAGTGRQFLLLDSERKVLFSSSEDWQQGQKIELPLSGWLNSTYKGGEQAIILEPKVSSSGVMSSFIIMILAAIVLVAITFSVIGFVIISSVKRLLAELKNAMRDDLQNYDSSHPEISANDFNVAELAEVVNIFHRSIMGLKDATTSKAEVQSILDSLDLAIVITDEACRTLSFNGTADQILELERNSPLAASFAERGAQALFEANGETEVTLQGQQWYWRRVKKQGSNQQDHGYVVVGANITSIRQAEQRLKLLKAAVDHATIGILIAENTPEQPLVFVNEGFEAVTGYTAKAALGRKCDFLQGPETSPEAIQNLRNAIAQCESIEVEIANYKADGALFWNELSLSPVNNDKGETTHYIGIQSDVTEKVQAQRQLVEAMQEAESANQLKSEFVANMSHEIRTPMNAISGLSELCLATELTKKQRDYVQKIRLSSQALLSIINDILDFSKIEANKLELDYHKFSLHTLLDQSCAIFAEQSRAKNVPIYFDVDPLAPSHFIGDSMRLQQILNNLLSNALKFTQKGRIDVQVRYAKASVTISVADTGIGLSAEQQKKLFSAFTQADSSTSRKFGGTGLGLNISRRLAELMGGSLTVTSALDQGTTFTLQTPMAKDPQHEGLSIEWPKVYCQIQSPEVASYISSILAYTPIAQALTPSEASIVLADDELLVNALADKGVLINTFSNRSNNGLLMPFTPYQLLEHVLKLELSEEKNWQSAIPWFPEAKVLVAEDNEINRQIVNELLAQCGVSVWNAHHGQQALDLVEAQAFDLILMDVQMPVMDGLQAATELRRMGVDVPIVALTANAMVSDRLLSKSAGMNAHLAKPFKPNELFDLLVEEIAHLQQGEVALEQETSSETELASTGLLADAYHYFDEEHALQNMANSKPTLVQVAQQFVNNHQHDIQQAALQAPGDAQRQLHTLKGLIKMLSGAAWVDELIELEMQLKGGTKPEDAEFSRLQGKLNEMVEEISTWLESNQ